ncbi:MAG: sensor histidine kinase, partial [Chloroflexota bacterium]
MASIKPLGHRAKRFLQPVRGFFKQLQWKLTLAYTLSTVLTALILGGIGLLLLWYINFRSNMLPNAIVESLIEGVRPLAPYLEQTPPDQAGLNKWLETVSRGGHLIINLPKEDAQDEQDTLPGQFGRLGFAAIVDAGGKALATAPAETRTDSQAALEAQLVSPLSNLLQAALHGETEPARLAVRDAAGHYIAAAPILGQNEQVVGAMFVKLAFPISEGEFLQSALVGAVLPVAVGMLASGLVAGIVFGYLMARGLTRRLNTLAEAADDWSRGDFSTLARDTSGDELGQLARRLNHMAEQLQNLLQTRRELATLEERNRLARELHDSVKQQIFAAAMQVGAARALLDQNPDASKENLAEAERLVRQAQQELTTLIRELRPAALEGKGLATALRDYAADWTRRTQIPVEVRVRGERLLPLRLEQALYRVAQEALTNISRHSGADAAEVELVWQQNEVALIISDNGRGFDPVTVNGKGLGLQSMRERVAALGGQLEIKSNPGSGAQIIA